MTADLWVSAVGLLVLLVSSVLFYWQDASRHMPMTNPVKKP
jgi:hypothetical protein